ncbi:MAG: DNA/RNA non-specific endonuclease [Rhodospirillales bacterium]|nr:DNA/RNA non-specific endonuclease [Rhodospirillales bacterium]
MARRNVEELKAYLETITSKRGGLDWLTSEAPTIAGPEVEAPAMAVASGGLESMPIVPTRADAMEGLKKLSLGQQPSAIEMAGMEAIILPDLRPAMTIVDGDFTVTHPLWMPIFTPEVRTRMRQAIPSIGRIEMPGNTRYPYGGTGFVVGKGLIMTNRHVAEIFARGIGDRHVGFIPGAAASINFGREDNGDDGINFRVRRIIMIHPYWDMALLAVDSDSSLPSPLKLSLHDARDLSDRDIAVVGYPAFDSRNSTDVQNKVMDGLYNVKRLQPGELKGGKATASFGKVLRAATHDCSTLGGNSGSALVDLTTGEVLALHFGGEYKKQNYAVPAAALGHDSRVIDAGVQFAGSASGGANEWQGWWNEADSSEASVGGDATDGDDSGGSDGTTRAAGGGQHPPVPPAQGGMAVGGSVTFELPLRITVSLRTEPVATLRSTETPEMAGLEALKEPDHDKNYSTRKGYSDDFLNSKNLEPLAVVPMPDAADSKVLAVTKAGAKVLHYQNFSLRMHATRRLALVTASNVTKERKLRKPEPSGDYTRRGLSGLGKNDQEKWFLDDRLEARYQLPDVFFTKDRTAFDKGHIVRRDDVAWGNSYAALRRANGDTYHVTNCSPQVAGFNRSTLGEDNWGDLENLVLSEAANERLCVFAGPVLRAHDTIFVGKGDDGTALRARIPSEYWKVVVARSEGELAAYGFVLDQDLSDVQFTEFAVPANFVKTMRSIEEIAEMTSVRFDKVIVDADQHDTVRGEELAARASIQRK